MNSNHIAIILAASVCSAALAAPISTSFTYQGQLNQFGTPASGRFDFQFEVFDIDTGGAQIVPAELVDEVLVSNGVFTVELDFGLAPYSGDQLWLEIAVREGDSTGGYTGLLPRQKVTAVPYALHAEYVAMNTVGTAEVDSTQIQLRVAQSCAPDSAIRGIAEDGSVICYQDVDPDSLPVGQTLMCPGSNKVAAIDGASGDVVCGADLNADTICSSGQFLNGNGVCVNVDSTGDCSSGGLCGGGHAHSQYLNSSGGTISGSLGVTSVLSANSFFSWGGNFFSATANGYLAVLAPNGFSCDQVCGNHNLSCSVQVGPYSIPSMATSSCASGASVRLCACFG